VLLADPPEGWILVKIIEKKVSYGIKHDQLKFSAGFDQNRTIRSIALNINQ